MKTLPKLSEYVKNIDKNIVAKEFIKQNVILENIYNYTYFITQPLNLSHFVPAIEKDGKWIVLEEPIKFENWKNYDYSGTDIGFEDERLCREYQTALDNVIFKGFEMNDKDETGFGVLNDKFDAFWIGNNGLKTIEDLIPYNLEVNEKIIKKFNL